MADKAPPMTWLDKLYIDLVERIAKRRGYLDIWSADPGSISPICKEVQLLFDKIVRSDERSHDRFLAPEEEEVLAAYRQNVLSEVENLKAQIAARNKFVTQRIRALSPQQRRTLVDLLSPTNLKTASSMLRPLGRL